VRQCVKQFSKQLVLANLINILQQCAVNKKIRVLVNNVRTKTVKSVNAHMIRWLPNNMLQTLVHIARGVVGKR